MAAYLVSRFTRIPGASSCSVVAAKVWRNEVKENSLPQLINCQTDPLTVMEPLWSGIAILVSGAGMINTKNSLQWLKSNYCSSSIHMTTGPDAAQWSDKRMAFLQINAQTNGPSPCVQLSGSCAKHQR